VLLAGLAPIAGTIGLEANGCDELLPAKSLPGGDQLPSTVLLMTGLLYGLFGRFLTYYRPTVRMSWFFGVASITFGWSSFAFAYANCHAAGLVELSGFGVAAWLAQNAGVTMVVVQFVFLPALFPDGRLLSSTWRRLFTWLMVFGVGLLLVQGLIPGPLDINNMAGAYTVDNPFGLPWASLRRLRPALQFLTPLFVFVGTALAISSFVIRFRRSSGETRQQFKLLAFFLSTVVVAHVFGFELIFGSLYPAVFEHWSYQLILAMSFGGFPVVIGLAIFRYRLYDIDIIIRRTLIYGLLTGVLALVYLGSVALLQSIFTSFSGQRSPLSIVISTLLIAALFSPLRRRVMRIVDRRFYRSKYDAGLTLSRFAATAREEVDIDDLAGALVEVVAETFQPDGIGIWLKRSASVPPRTESGS
jgi:hypothetical protein